MGLIIDSDFKQAFKEKCKNEKGSLIENLKTVFDLPPFHFSKYPLFDYCKKLPSVQFDPEIAGPILEKYFETGSPFILDYDEPYHGGSPKPGKNNRIPEENLNNNQEVQQQINHSWENFQQDVKQRYWEDETTKNKFQTASNLKLFEDRLPVTPREQVLSSLQIIEANGTSIAVKYNFFNITETLNYYERLITLFFPEYTPHKKASNKKLRRYAKKINDTLFLGLYIDFSFLERELKLSYLEFPRISVELFSLDMNACPKQEQYLKDQQDFPIARIDLYYFIGNLLIDRIGNSSQSEEHLKRELYFSMELYSFYLKFYLAFIEKQLKSISQ